MRPVLFELFGLKIHAFGTSVCLSFMFAYWISKFVLRRDRVSPLYAPAAADEEKKKFDDFLSDLGFGALVGGIVGARLWHVFQPENFGQYLRNPIDVLKVWEGGLVFYGGFVGAFVITVGMTIRKGIPVWHMGDYVAPAITFGQAIGRIGCFLNGCCYGTEVPWGIVIPHLHDDTPRHPAQIYEAAASTAIGLFLLWLLPRRKFHGQVFFTYVVLYAIARFVVEFVRDDPRGGLGPFSTSQWVAVAFLPVAVAALVIQRKRQPIVKPVEGKEPRAAEAGG